VSEAVTAALISALGSLLVGAMALCGVVLTNRNASKAMEIKLQTTQAVMSTKIDELTREVREHNNFAVRIPEMLSDINHMKTDIETLKKFHIKGE
jgi:cytochrome bd-type quinol oxidase subunit 1